MFDSRKLAFVLSAMLVAGAGLYGCEEEQDWGPITDNSSGSNGNGSGNGNGNGSGNGGASADDGTPANPQNAKKECQDAASCMTNPECSTKDGIAACLCATVSERCMFDASCHGIGSCKYDCGMANVFMLDGEEIPTCKMAVCAGKADCPDRLSPDGDADRDGILNGDESGCLDPMNPDTDGDNIPDGMEDINHNGKYEPGLGETDPCDRNSADNSNVSSLKAATCTADKMLNGKMVNLEKLRVVEFSDATYASVIEGDKPFTSFDHNTYDVVGFFGTAEATTGNRILKGAVGEGNYIEEANFKSSVPLASWSKSGIYDKSLQRIPDHTVDRYKLTIYMDEGDTLESLRNDITTELFNGVAEVAGSGSTKCADNKAIMYLARSTYSSTSGAPVRLYSGAISCRDTVTNPELVAAANVMDDTISGTLVAPTGREVGSANGYTGFKDFVCQAEAFGDSQGAVDFIWVIDNSGSMKDEIDNLTKTVDLFTERLGNSGIDYRLAVTTTDAYLLDEQGEFDDTTKLYKYNNKGNSVTYMPYDKTRGYCSEYTAYFNGLGIHTTKPQYPCMLDEYNLDQFKINVSKFVEGNSSTSVCPEGNTCGKGYEDGLKSAMLALERLYLDVTGEKPADYTDEWWNEFQQIKVNVAYQNYCLYYGQGFDGCTVDKLGTDVCRQDMMDSCMLRKDALKYIIFVSDEESRQFKEEGIESPHKDNLNGCLTGYELTSTADVYSMFMGMYTGEQKCNPKMSDFVTHLENALKDSGSASTLEDMTLEEIKASNAGKDTDEDGVGEGGYYEMISYYMDQMRKYGGSQSVVAFALVGDAGQENGRSGFCKELAVCKPADCTEYYEGKTPDPTKDVIDSSICKTCSNWDHNNAGATYGANYGLSYIHLARFLSTVYTDTNGEIKTDGKEGGYGSICNNDYTVTVDNIFADVVGRVAAHPLKGYPIASTITVSATINGKVVPLTRGANEKGWRYDASQNAIIFSFGGKDSDKPKGDDYIAISYVIWSEVEG